MFLYIHCVGVAEYGGKDGVSAGGENQRHAGATGVLPDTGKA